MVEILEYKSIDFVLAFPPADLDVPVYMELPTGMNPIMFQMLTNINAFSNSTKVFRASNKQDIIGLKNYVKDSLLVISFNVRLINVSSFERIILCSPVLMIALYFART